MASSTATRDKREEKRAKKEILAKLAELGGKMHDDDDIIFAGDKLTIPSSMTLQRARQFIDAKLEEQETETDFLRVFEYRPYDGAYCMYRAFKRVFGAVGHQGTPGFFFFPGDPPRMISVPIDVDKQEQIPWGMFTLPALEGVTFETGSTHHPELGTLFRVTASGPKKYAPQIEGVFKLIQEELETNSMYRGKAFDGQDMPEFVDLTGVDPEQVVYSQDVMADLEANIWAQLRYTEQFEAEGSALKRAVLIHGPYGTGKTLAAVLTGQEATRNGWTFIKRRPGRDDLSQVMQTARLYQPAVVFYEDVDQIADSEVAGESGITRMLDDFDGIDAKNTKILCILTTNHPERIHKGMGRPGRLDAMIKIAELDQEGMTKLVKARCKTRLADDIDWDAVFAAAKDYMPAFVTEFADRAIRYAMIRTKGEMENVKLVTEDLVHSAEGLRPQFELMAGAKDRHEKPKLEAAFGDLVTSVVRQHMIDDVLVEA